MPVSVRRVAHAVIYIPLIRKHGTLRHDVFSNDRQERCSLYVVSSKRSNTSLAFGNTEHWGLGIAWFSPRAHLLNPAHVGFVHLDSGAALPTKLFPGTVFVQHRTNLPEHAPRSLVRNARLPLNLFGRNPAASLSHEVDRVEPRGQRRRRFLKDSAGGRVNVMAAAVARLRRATHHAVMFAYSFASLAVDSIRVEVIAKPLKAGRIIRELLLEVLESVGFHRWFAVHGYLPTLKVAKCVPTVKG